MASSGNKRKSTATAAGSGSSKKSKKNRGERTTPRSTPFKACHSIEFGVSVEERDKDTGEVSYVVCRFCRVYGREQRPGSTQKAPSTTKGYRKPFRRENYVKHLKSQHAKRWAEYEKLDKEGKENYFQLEDERQATLHCYYGERQMPLDLYFDLDIVEKLAALFLDPEEVDLDNVVEIRKGQVKALKDFQLEYSLPGTNCKEATYVVLLDGIEPSLATEGTREGATTITENPQETQVEASSEDGGGTTEQEASEEPADLSAPGTDPIAYSVHIPNPLQYNLVLDALSSGVSFRATNEVLTKYIKRTRNGKAGRCSRTKVTRYARFCCVEVLQLLKDCIARSWTFAVALDMATKDSTGYLDIRVRFFEKKKGIVNLHVAAIPIHEKKTAQNLFAYFKMLFDVLTPEWRSKLIAISTDGEAKMTGARGGLATLVEQECGPNFIRVWCGAHQLDLAMQDCFSRMDDSKWYQQLTKLISYLRRQQNFCAKVSQCPKVATTRWLSMENVTDWFERNHHQVQKHLDEVDESHRPPLEFWIHMDVVRVIASESGTTFRALQGMTATLHQQADNLKHLRDNLMVIFSVHSITSPEEGMILSDKKDYGIFEESVTSYIFDMGRFFEEKFNALSADRQDAIVKGIAKVAVNTVSRIGRVVAERDSNNDAAEEIVACVPQKLATVESRFFYRLLRNHSIRLEHAAKQKGHLTANAIEAEFKSLQRSHKTVDAIKAMVKNLRTCAEFSESWTKHFRDTYPVLYEFCGGFCAVFPTTSVVESDFSIVNYEKDNRRKLLTDLSLEGILHSKQREEVMEIARNFKVVA